MRRASTKPEPTGLRKFLKDAWDISIERAKTNKALRALNTQQWSVEFLTALLYRASVHYGQQLEMTITSPQGASITVRTADKENPTPYKDDDIFNHLDNDVKIQQFLHQMTKGVGNA